MIEAHPTVRAVRSRGSAPTAPRRLEAGEIREIALRCGADDVGFVGIDRPEIADQRAEIERSFPPARTLISFVCRMNRQNIRATARSAANVEFHHTVDHCDEVARRIARALEEMGVPAFYPAAGFPMEMGQAPRIWIVSHKPVAVAAGLGRMGIHRNVIHPRFGNFVLLGTVLTAAEIAPESRPLDFNPCLECKLCVAACPVGAIGADGHFDFTACYTHNYREFLGGFSDWVENIVESRNRADYRTRVTPEETSSWWQSLGFGPNYKAAYCMAVCPAGEDVIGPFLEDRGRFVSTVVRPLQQKVEPVYVVAGSDAEAHVRRRFPHKAPRQVHNGLAPRTAAAFIAGLAITFQREAATGLAARYHFVFEGGETLEATVEVRDRTIRVSDRLNGTCDVRVQADARTWVRVLDHEASLVWAVLRRRIRVRGSLRLLRAFGRCFPR